MDWEQQMVFKHKGSCGVDFSDRVKRSIGGRKSRILQEIRSILAKDLSPDAMMKSDKLKQDILGNQLQLATGSVFFAKSHFDNGDLIPLAVTTNTRARELPNVPTIDEQGFSGFNTSAWFAVLAPADTPPAIINVMNKAINKILKSEEVSNKLKVQGIDIVGGSPEKATSWIGKQIGFWGKFVIENNIKEN